MFIKVVWKIGQIVELCPTEVTYEGVRRCSSVIRATLLVYIAGLGLPRPGPFLSEGVCRIRLLLLIVRIYRFCSIFADVIVLKGLDQSFTASVAVHNFVECLISHKVGMRPCLGFFRGPAIILSLLIRAGAMAGDSRWKLRGYINVSGKLIFHLCEALNVLTQTGSQGQLL